jgi:hypothetical protein
MDNINKNVVVEFVEFFYDTNFNNQNKNSDTNSESDCNIDNDIQIKRDIDILEIKDSNDLFDDIEVTTDNEIDNTNALEIMKNVYEIVDVNNIHNEDDPDSKINELNEKACFCETFYYIINWFHCTNTKKYV